MSRIDAVQSPISRITLANCEDEPIHIPGAIQPFSILFVFDDQLTLQQVSRNVEEKIPLKTEQLLGMSLHNLFKQQDILEELVSAFQDSETNFNNPYLFTFKECDTQEQWEAFCHKMDGQLILEIEKYIPEEIDENFIDRTFKRSITSIQDAKSVGELCHIVARKIQKISQFDRVMIYQFDDNWNGKVVAEQLSGPDIESYMGHHFPATDIPAMAREVFLHNWLRVIPDAQYKPSPLVPPVSPKTGRPFDMSRTFCRSVSPIHLQFLKNMNVGASMTISIMSGGKLWGLVACHHRTPHLVSTAARSACKFIGKMTSSLIRVKEDLEDLQYIEEIREQHARVLNSMLNESDLAKGLVADSEALLKMVGATGAAAAIHYEGQWRTAGDAPSHKDLNGIVQWLSTAHGNQDVFETHKLPILYPPAESFKNIASGLLAISIPRTPNSYVLWFLPEIPHMVTWAGNPHKQVITYPDGSVKIEPRASFEGWKEQLRNQSRAWKKVELDVASLLRNSIITLDLKRQFSREKDLRMQMETLAENLQKSLSARDEFLSIASHELKTPLASLKLQSQLFQRGLDKGDPNALVPERLRGMSEQTDRQVNRLTRLVDDMLDVARIRSGQLRIQKENMDFYELLTETIERMRLQFNDSPSGMPTLKGQGPIVGFWDRTRLEQVITNLLTNTLRYGQGRPIEVTVEVKYQKVHLSVKDEGLGVPKELQAKIFERFERATSENDIHGLGLGLFITKQIVLAHGGRIWVESEPQKGSTFYVEIPLTETSTNMEATASKEKP